MGVIFNFGLSQDDARSEKQFLRLVPGDRVLCLASGGEVPLDLLSGTKGIEIDAVDLDQGQLFLTRLKYLAAIHLDQLDAGVFIGYMKGNKTRRIQLYKFLEPHLSWEEQQFWEQHRELFKRGPIHAGRFETYIRKYNKLVNALLGKKHLTALMKIDEKPGQEAYFDQHFRTGLLRAIFKFAFHPRVYKNRGVVEEGLQHSHNSNMADFFFNRFRSFCVSNPAAINGYYQFTFFNEILSPDGLPDFLQEKNNLVLRAQSQNLNLYKRDIREHLEQMEDGFYNKVVLSNLSDWMSRDEMTDLLKIVLNKTKPGTRILARYIHAPILLTKEVSQHLRVDQEAADELISRERYPFYSVVAMEVV